MATPQIPKFNKSLSTFSRTIQVWIFVGILGFVVGTLLVFGGASNGDLLSIYLGVALFYLGGGLLGLAIAGAFLRQTAKIIVEGLGGTISIETPEPGYVQANAGFRPKDGETEDSELWGKLTTRQYDAWITAGQPKLKSFWAKNGEEDFFDWLEKQKAK